MASRGDERAARPASPLGEDEDSYGDIWDQLEAEAAPGGPEAFTEFAVSPGALARRGSLRRREAPAIEDDEAPGQHETADDVRSLLDQVIEEALPTHPQVERPTPRAFPGEEAPTLRPAEAPAAPAPTPAPAPRPVGRDVATQLVDAEALAMEHAVGAVGARRPPSFDALPASISDEVKQAPKVLRGRPDGALRHLTDDLAVDPAAPPPPTASPPPRLAPPPARGSELGARPRSAGEGPQSDPELERGPDSGPPDAEALELAFDPRRPRAASVLEPAPAPAPPAPSARWPIGLAVALVVLLGVLILRSLL